MSLIDLLIISPLIIPLFTGIVCMLGIAIRPTSRKIQHALSFTGSAIILITSIFLLSKVITSGIQVVQIGSWPMPFGITLVADQFSTIMVLISAIIGLTGVIYSLASINPEREKFGYYPVLFFLLLGINGAFLTGDLFNLYVWFEVMLMSSFVLMGIGQSPIQTSGSIKYVTINLFSSAIFLTALGILYGLIGTLNMADLAVKFSQVRGNPSVNGIITLVSALFLICFGIKAAVFPLFFWLPDSYYNPPPAISAIFAGLLTKVGVYALIRTFTLIFPLNQSPLQTIVIWIAGLTMIIGVLGAVAQNEVRRILSFHIISQIGYMVMGLAIFSPLALAGSVFYIFHHVMVKTNLFFISGVIERMGGTGELKKLGGFYNHLPYLAIFFIISAFSLAGLPPLSGFFAKLILLQSGIFVQSFWLVTVALFVSFLTLYSMTKIWAQVFWKPTSLDIDDKGENIQHKIKYTSPSNLQLWLTPIFLLSMITLLMGIGSGILFPFASFTGEELFNPTNYIEAVFRSGQ